jgi:hydrogenase expression/formation protein HypC
VCLAIPGRVTEFVDESLRLATVDVAGVRRTINLSLVDTDERPAQVGDWVLIHVGFALSLVDEEEANQTLTRLQAMGADYEAELTELRESAIQ